MSVPLDFIKGDGPHLVEASAGTGKTTWMVKTAVRFLLADPLLPRLGKPERLLGVTFTRAATAELKERLHDQLQRVQLIRDGAPAKGHEDWIPDLLERGGAKTEQALQQALSSMDRLAVTTIHSFFKGVLEEFAFECGVPVGLTFLEDVSPYIETALADEWRTISWAPGVESHLLFGGAVNLDHGTLIKQVKRVRGAIGAERPPRVDRTRLLDGTMEALDAVAKAFDAERMRAYYDSIKWNKTAPKIEQIDELALAVAEHSPEKPIRIALIAPWTSAAVDKNASGVGKVNKQIGRASCRERV